MKRKRFARLMIDADRSAWKTRRIQRPLRRALISATGTTGLSQAIALYAADRERFRPMVLSYIGVDAEYMRCE